MSIQDEQQSRTAGMQIDFKEARKILTQQRRGFLAAGPYPYTHSLSAYLGCGFGQTTCGLYCYAQFLPNWTFHAGGTPWGSAIQVKTNAAELLAQELARMSTQERQRLRIFMSSTTDPYQPAEHSQRATRHCLEIFAAYPDLDLLVIQTRSPLAQRDLSLLTLIPYAYLSVTIETDDQAYLKQLHGGPQLAQRWELVQKASELGIPTQITVSPCLKYSDSATFGQKLLTSGANRIVVDTFIDGDGSRGARTARSPFARIEPSWQSTTPAHLLYRYLIEHAAAYQIETGWSTAGFCGIKPRALR